MRQIIYRLVQKKIAQSLMYTHSATVCSRITRFYIEMLRKDQCLPVNANFVSSG